MGAVYGEKVCEHEIVESRERWENEMHRDFMMAMNG
jgi:hypothetical protein